MRIQTLAFSFGLLLATTGTAQVKYLPQQAFPSSAFSEFTPVPAQQLAGRSGTKMWLAELPASKRATLEDMDETAPCTQDTAVIMRLLRLNNALANWWQVGVMTGGDYFVVETQGKVKTRQMHYYRLYLANESTQQYDAYCFAVNMSSELLKLAGVNDATAPAFFAGNKNWRKGTFTQKHGLTADEKKTAVPAGAVKLFEESYYYCPNLIDETDGTPYSSFADADWNAFTTAYSSLPPVKGKKLTDADKAGFRKYSVYYLK